MALGLTLASRLTSPNGVFAEFAAVVSGWMEELLTTIPTMYLVEIRARHFRAARTIARMPLLSASGNVVHASMISERSGSVLQLSVGRWWERLVVVIRKLL